MIAFLLTMLMVQGIPALPGQTGTVSGTVRTSTGMPAAGVRISAMVAPEAATDAASAASFSALAQTDEDGRYRLEAIPVGRYFIVAGRVDLPTFFPGTADMSQARIFSVTAGGAVSGIDFVMVDISFRSTSPTDLLGSRPPVNTATLVIPVHIQVEGGAKIPVFASGAFTAIRFTDVSNGSSRAQILRDSVTFTTTLLTLGPEYRVRVENLPEGYILKTMTYGAADVLTKNLKVPPELAPRLVVQTINGVTQSIVASVPPAGVAIPELDITLATVPLPDISGVRVTGRFKDVELRSVYLSGHPGTLYSDGSFEFKGVPPGRHSVTAIANPSRLSLGASIVVGDRSIDGIELEAIAVLPLDAAVPSEPGAAGKHAPGSMLPLVSLRGRLLEEASGKPIEEGTVRLIGRDQSNAKVGSGGQFEFSRLLPGTYELEVRIFGHSNVLQTIVVGDEDLRVDVKTLRLY